jgi:hypothetical protein
MIFRLGVKPRANGFYTQVNEDCQMAQKQQESCFRRTKCARRVNTIDSASHPAKPKNFLRSVSDQMEEVEQ